MLGALFHFASSFQQHSCFPCYGIKKLNKYWGKKATMIIVFGICIEKKTSKASLFNIKLVVWSPKSGVITERSNRAKAANANTHSHSGLLWGRGRVEGWGPLIMNPVSSLRRQMIKTYLPASNAALVPQKMLQSWICKAREPFSLLVK